MQFVMPDLAGAVFWVALGKIIVANVILSGDNAVVIAMACRNLSKRHRMPAIVGGSIGAIVLRIIFVFVITWLLSVPYLKLIGGALLLWIGVKLLNEEEGGDDGGDGGVKAKASLWGAVWTIIVADAIMSLDNAIAIAAAADNDGVLIMAGLAISIPIIIFGSTLLTSFLQRYPVLVIFGGALLGWIGGEVIATDGKPPNATMAPEGTIAAWLEARIPHTEYVCAAAGALLVVALGLVLSRRRKPAPVIDLVEKIDLVDKKD
jgi:YjbE family integral membrane protein